MFLIDTQILIWFITKDSKLTPHAESLIINTETVLVPTAALWEIAIKLSIGKLNMGGTFDDLFPEQLIINDLTVLPVRINHLSRVARLPFHHRDPFDRLIIAQSLEENLPIISSDSIFDAYSVAVQE